MTYHERVHRVGGSTVQDARRRVYANLEEGTHCPCCDRVCKEYPRKLHWRMAAALIWLVREYERQPRWIHVMTEAPRFVLRTNEHGLLRWWGLIEQQPNIDSTKRTSGIWRPTPDGIDFVHGRTLVPSHAYLYNNELRRMSDTSVSIEEALTEKFDYQELMNGRYPR